MSDPREAEKASGNHKKHSVISHFALHTWWSTTHTYTHAMVHRSLPAGALSARVSVPRVRSVSLVLVGKVISSSFSAFVALITAPPRSQCQGYPTVTHGKAAMAHRSVAAEDWGPPRENDLRSKP
jgi:hypothetical protein